MATSLKKVSPAATPTKKPAPSPAPSALPRKPKVSPPAPAKPVAAKREKLVRDSFTMPRTEYAVIAQLKQRAAGLARPAKKSELLRAGVKVLAAMDDAGLLAALGAVPAIKTGRPAGDADKG